MFENEPIEWVIYPLAEFIRCMNTIKKDPDRLSGKVVGMRCGRLTIPESAAFFPCAPVQPTQPNPSVIL